MNIPEGEIQVIYDVLQSGSELPAEVDILTFWSDILFRHKHRPFKNPNLGDLGPLPGKNQGITHNTEIS